jgi:uncharacterized protein
MEWIALLILITFSAIGFLAIFCTTIGTLIMLIGTMLYAVLTDFTILGPVTVMVLAALYAIGELCEFILTAAGAKWFGASNGAIVGALIGGVIGALMGATLAGIGLFFGSIAGIFVGAFTVEQLKARSVGDSVKSGVGGVLGRLGAIAIKLCVAITMCGVVIYRLMASAGLIRW